MTLIKITDDWILNTSQIEEVTRNGNYTDIHLKKGVYRFWDEDRALWIRLENADIPIMSKLSERPGPTETNIVIGDTE